MMNLYKKLFFLNLTLFYLLNSAPLFAQLSLVKDLNTNPQSSNPHDFIEVNGIKFFTAETITQGRELWKTDGTASGTVMVKDIHPGPLSSYPSMLVAYNGKLYFVASNGVHGTELWKSDGTAEGTVMVKDIYEGAESAYPTLLSVVNGLLLFIAADSEHGHELWKSDGSVDGTVLVKDIIPGSTGGGYDYFTVVNNTLFFTIDDKIHGAELWKSDGTANGTVIVKDIKPGLSPSYPSRMAKVNNLLYFTADDGTHGNEVWKSDGTASGTVMVKDIAPGNISSYAYLFTEINGTLYFNASAGGSYLWKSDGTDAGTVKVSDAVKDPNQLTNINGTLFFTGDNPATGRELWKSDGTTAGTVLVKDIASGNESSFIYNIINKNGTAYFMADDKVHGTELWKSDGTESGTAMVKDINSGSQGSNIYQLANLSNKLYFRADGEGKGTELWMSDGTAEGTKLVADIDKSTVSSDLYNFVEANGMVFFINYEDSRDLIYKTDGTAQGTSLLKEDLEGYGLTRLNKTLYFAGNTGPHGIELWKSDGTTNGTVMVKDIVEGFGGSDIDCLTPVNNILYFTATDDNGNELWRSDGTEAGTVMVKDIKPGSDDSYPQNLTNVNGMLYFSVYDRSELWKSDGTAQGTVLVKKMADAGSGFIDQLTASDGKIYFTFKDNTGQQALYVSDGTETGIKMLKKLWTNSVITNLTDMNGTLFFTGHDNENSETVHGTELWKTNGTVEGTVFVKAITSSTRSNPFSLTQVNNVLYFALSHSKNGLELWKSDGTETGTLLVKNIAPGLTTHNIENATLWNINGTLCFQAGDQVNGRHLWMSMGSECNTVRLTNEVGLSVGTVMALLNEKLIIPGWSAQHGNELFSYNTASDLKKPVITVNTSNPAVPILTSNVVRNNQWMKDGTEINGATATSYTVTSTGLYSVKIAVGDCLYAISDQIKIVPVGIISHPASVTQCQGTTATFSVNASDTETLTYQWKKAGTNIAGANTATLVLNQVTAADAASYTVEVKGSFGTILSNAATLTVNPLPNVTLADFAAVVVNSPALQLTGGSPAGGEYTYSGNVITQFTPSVAGSYSIAYRYTDPNTGCTNSATKTLTVNTSTGMGDISAAGNIKLFPNPATDHFVVEINSAEKQETELLLYKSSGTLVAREKAVLNEGLNKIQFNCHQYAKGSYLLKIVTGSSVTSLKITLN